MAEISGIGSAEVCGKSYPAGGLTDIVIVGQVVAMTTDIVADAAGFVPTVAGGTDAVNAGVSFSLRLRNAKSRGLTPVEAIQEIIDDGPSALGQAEPIKAEPMSFADLQAMAPRLARHPRYMDAEPSAADRGQPRRRGGD